MRLPRGPGESWKGIVEICDWAIRGVVEGMGDFAW